jgi:hypothetical protein
LPKKEAHPMTDSATLTPHGVERRARSHVPSSSRTASLFPDLPPAPSSATNSPRREAAWRADLTRAWGYWRGRAKDEAEAARIDAAFDAQLEQGPDFARYHRGSEFRDAPRINLDRNDRAKLMTLWRAIERGSWNNKEKGKHGGVIGKLPLRVLEAFLFVLYRQGRSICVPYEAIATAAMICRRSVASALALLERLGLLTIHRRIKRVKTPLGFRVVQDCNAYELHPPRGLGSIAARLFGGLAGLFDPESSECKNFTAKGDHSYSKRGGEQNSPKLDPDNPLDQALMNLGKAVGAIPG